MALAEERYTVQFELDNLAGLVESPDVNTTVDAKEIITELKQSIKKIFEIIDSVKFRSKYSFSLN